MSAALRLYYDQKATRVPIRPALAALRPLGGPSRDPRLRTHPFIAAFKRGPRKPARIARFRRRSDGAEGTAPGPLYVPCPLVASRPDGDAVETEPGRVRAGLRRGSGARPPSPREPGPDRPAARSDARAESSPQAWIRPLQRPGSVDRPHRGRGHDRDVRDAVLPARVALALAQIVEGLVHGLARRIRCRSANLLLLDLEVDLLAEHRHVPRCLDADADLLAHDRQHGHLNVIADHDRLIGLAGQDQHVDASLPTACRLPLKHVGVPTAKHQRAKVRPTYPRPGRATVAVGDVRSFARLPRRWRAGRCDHTSTRSAHGCARVEPTPGSRTSSRSPSSRSRPSSASRGFPPGPTMTAMPPPPVSTSTTRSTCVPRTTL